MSVLGRILVDQRAAVAEILYQDFGNSLYEIKT